MRNVLILISFYFSCSTIKARANTNRFTTILSEKGKTIVASVLNHTRLIITYSCAFILFCSCCSQKKMIENFLVEEVKKNNEIQKSTHLVLNSEQVGFTHAMQSFVVGRVTGSTPEELEVYTELRRKYLTNQSDEQNLFDNHSWKNEDLKSLPFKKIPQDSLSNFIRNCQKKGETACYYALSKPYSYRYKGRKFVFF